MVPTLQSLIDSMFKKEAKRFENLSETFAVRDAVLAKMSGYCPWPSRIDGFTKNGRRMKCYFYGSNNIGTVDVNQAIPFKDTFALIRLIKLRNPPQFVKGVKEIELQYGIPEERSALRETPAIM